MNRVLVLVEGQTEEAVVEQVLRPYLEGHGIWLIPTLLRTKRTKMGPDFKGGITSYSRASNDLSRLLMDRDAALVTTMIDLYALPKDFPGWKDVPPIGGRARATHLETAWKTAVGHPRFDPHLMLHETEALIFSDPMACDLVFPDPSHRRALSDVREVFTSPEDIDEGPDTAPSKRILGVDPTYQKVSFGPLAIEQIGLAKIRSECPHFDQWLRRIEAVGTAVAAP